MGHENRQTLLLQDGIYTHHQRRSNPNEFGVNAACIEGVNPRDLDPVKWSDGINHPSDRI